MKAVLVNYVYEPNWLKEYSDIEPIIYDRSDDGVDRNLTQYGLTYKTPNMGDVDYDKLNYLVENYDNLPEVFLWGKTNLFKFIDQERFNKLKDNKTFTPLLRQDHKTYADRIGQVNYYSGEIYHERADSWFFNDPNVHKKHFSNWQEWSRHFGLPQVAYIPFAPGGNYILTREAVHKYSRDLYAEMASFMPHSQRPAEAQAAERSYYLLWQK